MLKSQIKLDGNRLADHIIQSLKPRVLKYKQIYPPYLHIINIGDNPSSISYIKKKTQLASKIGIQSKIHHFQCLFNQTNITKQVQKLIYSLNRQQKCTGILLQLPLPSKFDSQKLLNFISPFKDVDCLTQANRKQMMLYSEQAHILPCTPAAILKIFDHFNIQVQSKRVTIVGRSKLVGTPLAFLLMNRNATVTVCHHLTRSEDISRLAKQSDILITAAGAPNLIKQVKKEGIVIDIGITRVQIFDKQKNISKGRLIGDVQQDAKVKNSWFYTPVPGGVGPLTVAMLMQNSVKLWEKQLKIQNQS